MSTPIKGTLFTTYKTPRKWLQLFERFPQLLRVVKGERKEVLSPCPPQLRAHCSLRVRHPPPPPPKWLQLFKRFPQFLQVRIKTGQQKAQTTTHTCRQRDQMKLTEYSLNHIHSTIRLECIMCRIICTEHAQLVTWL